MTELDHFANALFVILISAFILGVVFFIYFFIFFSVMIHRFIMRQIVRRRMVVTPEEELMPEVSLEELGIESIS